MQPCGVEQRQVGVRLIQQKAHLCTAEDHTVRPVHRQIPYNRDIALTARRDDLIAAELVKDDPVDIPALLGVRDKRPEPLTLMPVQIEACLAPIFCTSIFRFLY